MKISPNAIISEKIAGKAPGILKKIENDKIPRRRSWYAVTTAREPDELMYIISAKEYKLPIYRGQSMRLLGLASSKSEANEMVSYIFKLGCEKDAITHMKQFLEVF
jgi:hypothetical protein